MTAQPEVADLDEPTLEQAAYVQYGVETTWPGRPRPVISVCGSRTAAHAYLAKLRRRDDPPVSAVVIRRPVLKVHGAWEDLDQ